MRKASLMHRLIRFLSVAFREYLREMSTPSLGGPDILRLMKKVYPPRFFLSPPRRMPSKLLRPVSLSLAEKPCVPRKVPCLSTSKTRAPQAPIRRLAYACRQTCDYGLLRDLSEYACEQEIHGAVPVGFWKVDRFASLE